MKQATSPDVTVISVTFNSARDIVPALASADRAARRANLSLEIIVVDNASQDSSVESVRAAFPRATVIRNMTNVGFGRANNMAFEVASGRQWLLLNPDARLEDESLGRLVSALNDLGAGAVAPSIGDSGAESCGMAPALRSALGHFLFANRLLPTDRGGRWRGVQLRRHGATQPRLVEWASAAVLLLDAGAVRSVSGFDPRFFMYGEDLDLGVRLTRAGFGVWLIPMARAQHAIAGSQDGVTARWVEALHDHYSERASRPKVLAFDLAMAAGLSIRAALSRVSGRPRGRALHGRRMRAAAQCAWTLFFDTLS